MALTRLGPTAALVEAEERARVVAPQWRKRQPSNASRADRFGTRGGMGSLPPVARLLRGGRALPWVVVRHKAATPAGHGQRSAAAAALRRGRVAGAAGRGPAGRLVGRALAAGRCSYGVDRSATHLVGGARRRAWPSPGADALGAGNAARMVYDGQLSVVRAAWGGGVMPDRKRTGTSGCRLLWPSRSGADHIGARERISRPRKEPASKASATGRDLLVAAVQRH